MPGPWYRNQKLLSSQRKFLGKLFRLKVFSLCAPRWFPDHGQERSAILHKARDPRETFHDEAEDDDELEPSELVSTVIARTTWLPYTSSGKPMFLAFRAQVLQYSSGRT